MFRRKLFESKEHFLSHIRFADAKLLKIYPGTSVSQFHQLYHFRNMKITSNLFFIIFFIHGCCTSKVNFDLQRCHQLVGFIQASPFPWSFFEGGRAQLVLVGCNWTPKFAQFHSKFLLKRPPQSPPGYGLVYKLSFNNSLIQLLVGCMRYRPQRLPRKWWFKWNNWTRSCCWTMAIHLRTLHLWQLYCSTCSTIWRSQFFLNFFLHAFW